MRQGVSLAVVTVFAVTRQADATVTRVGKESTALRACVPLARPGSMRQRLEASLTHQPSAATWAFAIEPPGHASVALASRDRRVTSKIALETPQQESPVGVTVIARVWRICIPSMGSPMVEERATQAVNLKPGMPRVGTNVSATPSMEWEHWLTLLGLPCLHGPHTAATRWAGVIRYQGGEDGIVRADCARGETMWTSSISAGRTRE